MNIKKLVYLCFMVLFISSCSDFKLDDLGDVTITGNAAGAISDQERQSIENIEMATFRREFIGLKNRKKYKELEKSGIYDSTKLKLYITIDSTLTLKQYTKDVIMSHEGLASIEVYLEPRIIKGTVRGRTGVLLRGQFGKDYYNIQNDYYENGDIEEAILCMSGLLSDAHVYSKSKKNNIFTKFVNVDGINDIVDCLLSLLRPKDNIIGKTVKPIWSLSLFAAEHTSAIQRGFYLLCSVFLSVLVLLYIPVVRILRKGLVEKKGCFFSLCVILFQIVKLLMLVTLLTYSYYLCRPSLENVLALNAAYSFDASFLKPLYSDYNFVPAGSVVAIIASVAFCLDNIIKDFEKANKAAKDDNADSDTGEWAAGFFAFVVVCFLLDKTIVISFMCFYIVNVITKLIQLFFTLVQKY